MIETRRQRFKRIASARTTKILTMMKLLGNCANTGNYKYSKAEVKKIFTTLESTLNNTKELFLKQDTKNEKFSL